MIIAIAGRKDAGKSTLAQIIMHHRPGAIRIAFADPVKKMVSVVTEALGFPDACFTPKMKEAKLPEIGVSARYLMQTLGTEWGRDMVHPYLWVHILESRLNTLFFENPFQLVIVDDLRFESDREGLILAALNLRQQLIFIEVSAPADTSMTFFDWLKAWLYPPHRSERPINFRVRDFVVYLENNKESLDEFDELVQRDVLPHITTNDESTLEDQPY